MWQKHISITLLCFTLQSALVNPVHDEKLLSYIVYFMDFKVLFAVENVILNFQETACFFRPITWKQREKYTILIKSKLALG